MINLTGYENISLMLEGTDISLWRAVREDDGHPVLIKSPSSDTPSPRILAGLKNEYSIMEEIGFSGVFPTVTLFTTDNSLALVLEDRGYTMLDTLISENRIGVADRVKIALNAAKAVSKIHSKGFLHRNIQPSSIAVADDLSDSLLLNLQYGIRISDNSHGPATGIIPDENLPYISPEQTGRIRNGLDRRSDFYSLGATLYELFTGTRPFTSADPLELIHSHLAKMPQSPAVINPEIPEPVSEIILKLMAKSPDDRYQSDHGIIQDLKACLRILRDRDSYDFFAVGSQDISDTFMLPERLFGRTEETKQLLAAYSRAALGSSELVIVRGEPGCGKTALIKSLKRHVLKERGEYIRGKFDQFRGNRPYSAIVRAFQNLLRKKLNSPAPVMEAWKKRITGVLGANAGAITDVIPELEQLIGKQPLPPELPSAEDRNRFNRTFKDFIRVFPSMETPLLLFLDDLQWADTSSLQLIRKLLDDEETSYLIIVGAYRTGLPLNENILTELTGLEELDPNVETITLERLGLRHVQAFICRTLCADKDQTDGLARLVFNRTGGNPLFVHEYMRNLHRGGMIEFNKLENKWEWDLQGIRNLSMDGNIVEMMIDKIKSHPPEGQEILKTAACIGELFDLDTLTSVLDTPEDVISDYLAIAIREGLIVPEEDRLITHPIPGKTEPPRFFSFMHDRVQQAAYSMLDSREKTDLHLKIGRIMLKRFKESSMPDDVFETAAQFSLCLHGVTSKDEQADVARIFLLSGSKAMHSSAFEPAAEYISTAVRLFGADGWENNYRDTFDMYLDWFECVFLGGAAKQAEKIFRTILEHSAAKEDLAKANIAKIQLYFDKSRYQEAVGIGLEMLELYGIRIPSKPGKTDLALELFKTRMCLRKRSAESILNMPEMKDREKRQTMRLLMYTVAPAFMFNKKLVLFIVLRMVRLSLRHGNAPSSAYGYMFYAMFIAARFSDFNRSGKFAELAEKLNKRFDNTELEAKIAMLRGAMHDHWLAPLSLSISTLESAYQSGLRHGDNAYARYCAYFIVYYRFLLWESIDDVYNSSMKYSPFIRKNNNSLGNGVLDLAIQMGKSLQGRTFTPGYLDDEGFREVMLINMSRSSGSEVTEHWTGISKIITLTFFGCHSKALEYIERMYDRVEQTMFGMFIVPVFHLFSIINMAEVHRDSPPDISRKYLGRIGKSVDRLGRWEKSCPDNFRPMYSLARAEQSRLKGENSKALRFYEEAILSAQKTGANGFSGLACERAAYFHFSIGGKISGLALLSEACGHYGKWGATAKVKTLLRDNRQLLNSPGQLLMENQLQDKIQQPHSVDISAVIRASQAISGEIVLDRLLDKLIRIVTENAGAQKASLLLINNNNLELAAHAFVSETGITTIINPDQDRELYCKSIVNYVLRSRDNIVLRDAGAQGPFTIDSYVIRTRPKSILAMPVLNQRIMRGVLYLENNLTSGVFTEDRLQVLNLLCSQAAIAIQNARLYSELRESETQHRTLLESINVGAFRAEAVREGRLVKANRALSEIFGYRDWTEFRRIPLRSFFIDPQMHDRILEELLDEMIVRDREVNMRRKDGTPVWINMTVTLHRNGKNMENCIEGVLEDITEKRKARELEKEKVAADAANKAKSDFLASMSHEIRTPMNAILGMADMLWESRLNKIQRNYVKIFRNAGENLLLLINDILDLSKIEAGQINLEEIDFNIEEMFEDIGSIFGLRAQAKEIDFCWYIHPDVPRIITGDPTRIRQIIVNLVGNALKFTENGIITFEASITYEGLLRVLITDSGIGIPQDKLHFIFETFSQADSSTTRNFGGTGLGLSICTRMVESMHGGLFVSSEEGKGSTFAFVIPVGFPVQPEIPPPLADTIILVVDKNSACREFLCRGLTDIGAETVTADSLGEISSKAAEISLSRFEEKVIIIGHPDWTDDRFAIARTLKNGPCRDWKLIIIMDSKPQSRETSRARQLGAGWIHRPAHPAAVVDDIKFSNAYCMLPGETDDGQPSQTAAHHAKQDTKGEMTELHKTNSILLVEDSEDNRMVIDLFLQKTPYTITYAVNGQEGVEEYMNGNFDIVLMDIQMPVMDGYEATKAIRAYERDNGLAQTPILALTANAFREDEQRCLDCGCTAHMGKPVKKKELLRFLEDLLGPAE
ncbi:AAA family ATPase [Maridesulfovibrio sp.]|uniref:AAA family ATPase n=1 Tax=Maridesulfovibrio sp. TaxID=2795000 RepID=UPI002A18D255|nr:AAA family ATPase [Maridesulfovibrio sp.]